MLQPILKAQELKLLLDEMTSSRDILGRQLYGMEIMRDRVVDELNSVRNELFATRVDLHRARFDKSGYRLAAVIAFIGFLVMLCIPTAQGVWH